MKLVEQCCSHVFVTRAPIAKISCEDFSMSRTRSTHKISLWNVSFSREPISCYSTVTLHTLDGAGNLRTSQLFFSVLRNLLSTRQCQPSRRDWITKLFLFLLQIDISSFNFITSYITSQSACSLSTRSCATHTRCSIAERMMKTNCCETNAAIFFPPRQLCVG